MIRMWIHVESDQMSPVFLLSREKKCGVCIPRGILFTQPAVWYHVVFSFNYLPVCLRLLWFWYSCSMYILCSFKLRKRVSSWYFAWLLCLNRFIRHVPLLRFTSIWYLAMLWRFMFGHLDGICVEFVYGVHSVIRTSTQPFNVSQRLVLVVYTSR